MGRMSSSEIFAAPRVQGWAEVGVLFEGGAADYGYGLAGGKKWRSS